MNLFPVKELSQTECDLFYEAYRNPIIVKHLQIMAQNDAQELLSLNASGLSDRDLAIAHATVAGRLSTLQTLLDFATPLQSQEQQS